MKGVNPIVEEIKNWIGKYVKVKADKEEYKGVLLGVDISQHGGVGNVYLKYNERKQLIRGSSIITIALLETIQEKYNHR
jgi:small nuclear ribonucleoprotein (snRNP)-like protein